MHGKLICLKLPQLEVDRYCGQGIEKDLQTYGSHTHRSIEIFINLLFCVCIAIGICNTSLTVFLKTFHGFTYPGQQS